MRSSILLFLFFSSIFIMAVNGHINCDDYDDGNLPDECKCSSYSYDECPLTCAIDDCYAPDELDCDNYPNSRLPSICKCESYNQDNCPLACNGQCA